MSDTECTGCEWGYFLSNGRCVPCATSLPECVGCSSSSVCLECSPQGSLQNGECKSSCRVFLTTSMPTAPSILCVLQRRLCVRRVHAWNNTRRGRVHWSVHGNADVQSVTLRTATSVRHHPMHVRSAQKERSSATGSARVFSEPSDVQHAPPSSTASSVPTKHTARSATRRRTSLMGSAIVSEESRDTQRVTFPDAFNAAPSEGRVTSVVMGSSD